MQDVKTTPVDPDGKLPQDFPLTIASNGQYAKKHQGKRWHFGAVSAGWRAAIARYTNDWPYIIQGKVPPPIAASGVDAASFEFVARSWIAHQIRRLDRGEIKGPSFITMRNAAEIAAAHLGGKRRIVHMTPADFGSLRDALAFEWIKEGEGEAQRWTKTAKRLGPAALANRVAYLRSMFLWAGPNGEKLLPSAPNYGTGFRTVSERTLSKSRRVREREHGQKVFEPDQILPIFNELPTEQLQAMFLLSINCGFTAVDCGCLPWRSVNLDAKQPFIDFPRVKTGAERPRLFLWPETVALLRAVRKLELSAAPGMEDFIVFQDRGDEGEPIGDPIRLKDCVFITQRGRPWWHVTTHKDANGIPTTASHRSAIPEMFDPALVTLEIKKKGCGFGTGRHTFETYAKRVADPALVDTVMGHTERSMGDRYDHALDADLLAMVNGVRDRLLSDPKWRQVSGAAPASATGGLRLVG
jgi:integrase